MPAPTQVIASAAPAGPAKPGAPSDYPRDADGWPDVNFLVTEDDTPVDNMFSELQRRLLVEPLGATWQGGPERRPFIAASDVGVFFGDGPTPLVPDAFLSLDVRRADNLNPKENRSYFVWKFGKPPDVVIEIVSNRKGGEVSTKLRGYARGGVAHYAVYDPYLYLRGQPLRAYNLAGVRYRPVPEVRVPGTNLCLRLWPGRFEGHQATWLRWHDVNTGQPILTGAESAERERQRADEQQQRAQRLAERLRALGMDPEQV